MAGWVIAYGIVQALAPKITGQQQGQLPNGQRLVSWGVLLALIPCAIALALANVGQPTLVLVTGLLLFGALFAINSSMHSYLIVAYAQRDAVSLDVGFYYMANAAGRLLGTLLSGLLYQQFGMVSCLLMSSAMIMLSVLACRGLLRIT
jgi:predicted MFS family arabinose efflux permease